MQGHTKTDVSGFVNYAVDKGLVPQSVARGWRAAANAVLEDVAPDADVRSIDLDAELVKYTNRHPGSLSPETLRRYRSWATALLENFQSYMSDRIACRPRAGLSRKALADQPNGRAKKGAQSSSSNPKGAMSTRSHGDAGGGHVSTSLGYQPATLTAGLTMPFPLRPDFRVQVVVPADLTVAEARRLGAFLLTLANDYAPSA